MVRLRAVSCCTIEQCLLLLAVCFLSLSGCSSGAGVRVFPMGGRAEAGPIVYSVLEAHWTRQIGEGPTARTAKDRFVLLRISVTNGSPRTVSIPLLTMIGPDGQEYRELTDGEGVTDWLGMLRSVEPVDTITGWALFDVPRANYQLRVTDDAFDPADAKVALIEIPLRLEATPDFQRPGQSVR